MMLNSVKNCARWGGHVEGHEGGIRDSGYADGMDGTRVSFKTISDVS